MDAGSSIRRTALKETVSGARYQAALGELAVSKQSVAESAKLLSRHVRSFSAVRERFALLLSAKQAPHVAMQNAAVLLKEMQTSKLNVANAQNELSAKVLAHTKKVAGAEQAQHRLEKLRSRHVELKQAATTKRTLCAANDVFDLKVAGCAQAQAAQSGLLHPGPMVARPGAEATGNPSPNPPFPPPGTYATGMSDMHSEDREGYSRVAFSFRSGGSDQIEIEIVRRAGSCIDVCLHSGSAVEQRRLWALKMKLHAALEKAGYTVEKMRLPRGLR